MANAATINSASTKLRRPFLAGGTVEVGDSPQFQSQFYICVTSAGA